MVHKLIKTDKYLLIVNDKEIEERDWFINITQNEIYNHNIKNYSVNKSYLKKIIAHLPLNSSPILEGVDLLPPIDDVEQVTEKHFPDIDYELSPYRNGLNRGFKQGYNKAREKYKYTEEDVIRMVEKSRIAGLTAEYLMLASQYPTEFECEMDIVWVKNSYGRVQTKDDLHGVPKTTTINGHRVWVGKYK